VEGRQPRRPAPTCALARRLEGPRGKEAQWQRNLKLAARPGVTTVLGGPATATRNLRPELKGPGAGSVPTSPLRPATGRWLEQLNLNQGWVQVLPVASECAHLRFRFCLKIRSWRVLSAMGAPTRLSQSFQFNRFPE
jgi:hypothetical protein